MQQMLNKCAHFANKWGTGAVPMRAVLFFFSSCAGLMIDSWTVAIVLGS